MQKYRILVQGRNLLTEIDGVRQKCGFYTTLYLEGFSQNAAESLALETLKHDAQFCRIRLNREDDPEVLTVSESQEIESFGGVKLPRRAFAFYFENMDAAKSS